ncbi:uncharacterized protein [Centruroides vittatus]|uniref:uncharacterized protein n=1 Tax=Centruroides vittatus TaxID=120091 RepID=UPI00350FEDF0
MKKMFSIIFTCVMFMMVLGDGSPNELDLNYYCQYPNADGFHSCLQNTLSYQVKTVFNNCVNDVAGILSPKELQVFFCNQAAEQKIKDLNDCLDTKLNVDEMSTYNNVLKKCLGIS